MEILDQAEVKPSIVSQRRKLLPWWVKFFSVLFLIAGVIAVLAIPASLFGANTSFNIFGFSFNGTFNLEGVTALLISLFSGIVAFGLLWGKDWAVQAAIGLCIAELLLSMVMLFVVMNRGYMSLHFEFLLLIPFCYKMFKIADAWEEVK